MIKFGIAFLLMLSPLLAGVKSGEVAPDFTLKDTQGQSVNLSDFKGKTVVLEWVNFDCPFVKKFYGSGEMQRMQKQAEADGIIWLSINSSAEGKQGNYDRKTLSERMKANGASPKAYLQDQNGAVGRVYEAKTTPHMFVVNPDGMLVYQGAIDSIRSTEASDIPKATNYVVEALSAIKMGKSPEVNTTRSYGCGVKY